MDLVLVLCAVQFMAVLDGFCGGVAFGCNSRFDLWLDWRGYKLAFETVTCEGVGGNEGWTSGFCCFLCWMSHEVQQTIKHNSDQCSRIEKQFSKRVSQIAFANKGSWRNHDTFKFEIFNPPFPLRVFFFCQNPIRILQPYFWNFKIFRNYKSALKKLVWFLTSGFYIFFIEFYFISLKI